MLACQERRRDSAPPRSHGFLASAASAGRRAMKLPQWPPAPPPSLAGYFPRMVSKAPAVTVWPAGLTLSARHSQPPDEIKTPQPHFSSRHEILEFSAGLQRTRADISWRQGHAARWRKDETCDKHDALDAICRRRDAAYRHIYSTVRDKTCVRYGG